MMILDLDFFKKINDEHGHTAGDKVLSSIGNMLMSTCRQGDFVARIGGEEFTILLPHCCTKDALIKAEEIRENIEQLKPAGLTVTASIGLASLADRHFSDFDSLYKDADTAVYQSKENGRNQVTFYEHDESLADAS